MVVTMKLKKESEREAVTEVLLPSLYLRRGVKGGGGAPRATDGDPSANYQTLVAAASDFFSGPWGSHR